MKNSDMFYYFFNYVYKQAITCFIISKIYNFYNNSVLDVVANFYKSISCRKWKLVYNWEQKQMFGAYDNKSWIVLILSLMHLLIFRDLFSTEGFIEGIVWANLQ